MMVGVISTLVSSIVGVSCSATAEYWAGKLIICQCASYGYYLRDFVYFARHRSALRVSSGPNTPQWINQSPVLSAATL